MFSSNLFILNLFVIYIKTIQGMCKASPIFLKLHPLKEERKKNDYMHVNGIVLVQC